MKKLLEICKNGDAATRLSMVIMGAGYCARGQYVKGIIMTVIEVLFFLFTFRFSWQYICKLNTLGTVQREEYLDLTTLQKTVNDYDNSLLILLCGIIGILFYRCLYCFVYQQSKGSL